MHPGPGVPTLERSDIDGKLLGSVSLVVEMEKIYLQSFLCITGN